MKVFLSWSGEVSHRVAKAFDGWLPYVIQGVEPFLSSDISKGDRWNDVLVEELKEAKFGIICVTPYNIYKPWMNFEAGTLSKTMTHSSVVPFLFNVKPDDLEGPLSQFQSTLYDKSNVLRLVQSINKLAQGPLNHERMEVTFNKWWENLDNELKDIPATSQVETRTHYDWLYTREDLDIYDPARPYSSVWLIVGDAAKYLDDRAKDALKKLSKTRRRFRFFLPDTESDFAQELQEIAKECPGLEYKFFNSEDFETQVATDYIICNPDNGVLSVRVKIPLGDPEYREYWFKTNDRSARSFINRFQKMWNSKPDQSLAAAR
jgi:hypothetical protein